MAYDYDRLYGETPDALGQPTSVFVDFFDGLKHPCARVLDVGCGQGRDAIFIARRGHDVLGVDLSPNGIRDLTSRAERENLTLKGVVADITSYTPPGRFDIILVDRTLHMLPEVAALKVLADLLEHVRHGGWCLIADEASNIGAFRRVFEAHHGEWTFTLAKRGYLFARLAEVTTANQG